MPETVSSILKQYLADRNADGLVNEFECGCDIDDLIPCGADPSKCQPAKRVACTCPDHNGAHFSPIDA